MKFITIKLLALFLSAQCLLANHTDAALITKYQPTEQITILQNELTFWQKRVAAAPDQQSYKTKLANAYTALFSATAKIEDLKKAEMLLIEAIKKASTNKASILRALAHNYISQHRFCEAMDLVVEAHNLGSDRRASELMLFDLYEELGDEAAQQSMLRQLSDKKDFNYLIRLAKWEDGQGRLDNTIALMKQAEAIAISGKQKGRMTWVFTNLADYYGHAGEIDLSKSYYLKALDLNPADWYSMKGLAWMAYSHDQNPEEALAILAHIKTGSADPGIRLLETEILEHTGFQKAAKNSYKEIATIVSAPSYGHMYNGFLCDYFLTNKMTNKAMAIAKNEMTVRATPQSYDLLAQVLYATGDVEGARQISKTQIWSHTFEPGILKNQLTFFKNSDAPFVKDITIALQDAAYELGPLTYQKLFGDS